MMADEHGRHGIRAPALPAPSSPGEASEGAAEAPSEAIMAVVLLVRPAGLFGRTS